MPLYLDSETSVTQCRKNVFAIGALVLLVLLTYWNTFDASWHFDDEPNILDREAIHLTDLSWSQIRNTFFNENGLYRPVACLSLAINYYFNGEKVFGYHVVNLSIHILASIFLYLFVLETLNLPLVRARYESWSYFIALLATILWAINPIQTQAVTYVVQRMASMAAMFYIMSMYFYLKGRISDHTSTRIALYILCAITGLLAFGSKENTATLPISLLFFDLFLIQGINAGSVKRSLFMFLLLAMVPLAFALLLKGPAILNPGVLADKFGHRSFTLVERLLTEPRVIIWYISLLLYPMPHRLSIAHDLQPSQSFLEPPTTLLALLIIGLLLFIAFIKSKKWPMVSYCIVFFFLNHLIESTVFPLELVFEHRNYLPSMLFFVPISIAFVGILRWSSESKKMVFYSVSAFVVILLTIWGHSTFIRNSVWKNEESLWLNAIEKYPNSARAHHNLGRYYANTLQLEKALAQYHTALEKDRGTYAETHQLTHYNLALIYMKRGNYEKAKKHLLRAIKFYSRFADAYNNLSIISMREGDYEQAQDYLVRSLTHERKNPEAHNNLGYVLLKRNQTEAAIDEFQKALRLKEGFRKALHNLGIAHKYKGNFLKSEKYFQAVLRDDPAAVMTRLHLAETYYLTGKRNKALRTISDTFKFLNPEEAYSQANKILEGDALAETPNLEIVLPLVRKVYENRAAALNRMGEDLANQ